MDQQRQDGPLIHPDPEPTVRLSLSQLFNR